MARPRLLDLFCGAGGAAMGYHRAGFDVVGVDVEPQPRYPFEFHQADAMTWPLAGFDVIHASPPCQGYSTTQQFTAGAYPLLVLRVLELLKSQASPWVIENVEGAPLPQQATLDGAHGVMLCGTMFGLGTVRYKLRRHRLFETSLPIAQLPDRCAADPRFTIGIYGNATRARGTTGPSLGMDQGQAAMGINWMTGDELCEAIPPAYTEHIGAQLRAALPAAA
jgi:DNA (cytosine-5)-methyltransferase 1